MLDTFGTDVVRRLRARASSDALARDALALIADLEGQVESLHARVVESEDSVEDERYRVSEYEALADRVHASVADAYLRGAHVEVAVLDGLAEHLAEIAS